MVKHSSRFTPHRFLITGGCGFIGTNLIRKLTNEGDHQIRILDNLSVGTREDLAGLGAFVESEASSALDRSDSPDVLHLMVGDIRDPEACRAATQNADVIVHLAANTGVGPSVEDPKGDMEANVAGAVNMLEAARENGVQRFVFASSGAPVGEVEPPIHEELAPHPVSPYGASKLAGEGYCSAYRNTFGLETVALRFGNVYGPGSSHKSSVVAKFIRQALEGKTCEIYGDGSQTRDFIYIDDLTEAILKAVRFTSSSGPLPWGQVFQIATSQEHTVLEVAERLGKLLKDRGIALNLTHGAPRLGDVRRNYSDTTRAREVLHWQAQTNLDQGLEKTVGWFLNQGTL